MALILLQRQCSTYRCYENASPQASTDKYGFYAAFGGARRDEESHAPKSVYSFRDQNTVGIQKTSVPVVEYL